MYTKAELDREFEDMAPEDLEAAGVFYDRLVKEYAVAKAEAAEELRKLFCTHPIEHHYHSLKDTVIGRFYCMLCEQIISSEEHENV